MTSARALLVAGAITAAIAAAHPSPARADPSTGDRIAFGAALAIPDYIAGVSFHESMHALAGVIVGAKLDELHVFPPGTDPHAHHFRFGWTYVHDLRGHASRTVFFLAPKIADSLLLGAFAALVYSSHFPANGYGQTAVTVVGTGLWIDYAKDLPLLGPTLDVSQAEKENCIRGWRRVVSRTIYAATVIGWAVVVEHAYRRTFDDSAHPQVGAFAPPPAALVPLFHAAF